MSSSHGPGSAMQNGLVPSALRPLPRRHQRRGVAHDDPDLTLRRHAVRPKGARPEVVPVARHHQRRAVLLRQPDGVRRADLASSAPRRSRRRSRQDPLSVTTRPAPTASMSPYRSAPRNTAPVARRANPRRAGSPPPAIRPPAAPSRPAPPPPPSSVRCNPRAPRPNHYLRFLQGSVSPASLTRSQNKKPGPSTRARAMRLSASDIKRPVERGTDSKSLPSDPSTGVLSF